MSVVETGMQECLFVVVVIVTSKESMTPSLSKSSIVRDFPVFKFLLFGQ